MNFARFCSVCVIKADEFSHYMLYFAVFRWRNRHPALKSEKGVDLKSAAPVIKLNEQSRRAVYFYVFILFLLPFTKSWRSSFAYRAADCMFELMEGEGGLKASFLLYWWLMS